MLSQFKIGMFLAVLLSFFMTTAAYATADGPDWFKNETTESIKVYSQPTLGAGVDVLGTIAPNSDYIQNLGCIGFTPFNKWAKMNDREKLDAKFRIWCHVAHHGLNGWVRNIRLTEGVAPEKPSFDCDATKSEIEGFVCRYTDLISLDLTMDAVYKKALTQVEVPKSFFSTPKERELRATQRGWVKGRDDCWKDERHKKQCVVDRYKRRISYLKTKWDPMYPSDNKSYVCGQTGDPLSVSFFDTLLPSVKVEYQGQEDVFVFSETENKDTAYVGNFGRTLIVKKSTALFTWDQNQAVKTCRVQK